MKAYAGLALVLLCSACGGMEFTNELPFPSDSASSSSDAGATPSSPDAGTDSPLEFRDASAVDSSSVDSGTEAEAEACTPVAAHGWTCTVNGESISTMAPASLCSYAFGRGVATVPTPTECLCSYTCACIVAAFGGQCAPGNAIVSCDDTGMEGYGPVVTCEH